jgi:glutamine amidotransferase
MEKVCILDYGSGNVKSVKNAFAQVSNCVISNDKKDIMNASHLVLPGVGSYKDSMERISKIIPIDVLLQEAINGKPLLGICVGMQVLGQTGVEFEKAEGLGILPGIVSRINSNSLPLPHVGWNNLIEIENSPLTVGITEEDDFYFVHSYGYTSLVDEFVIARAHYGSSFPVIVSSGNTYGVQFHPEKSQKAGNKLIENFIGIQ